MTAALMAPDWCRRPTIPTRAIGSDESPWTGSQNTRKRVSKDKPVGAEVTIRALAEQDTAQVRELFITVNRVFSPQDLRDAFEAYIERALTEEIDRISAYYSDWVAVRGNKVVGTFGLEHASNARWNARYVRSTFGSTSRASRGRCSLLKKAENIEEAVGGAD